MSAQANSRVAGSGSMPIVAISAVISSLEYDPRSRPVLVSLRLRVGSKRAWSTVDPESQVGAHVLQKTS